MKIENQKAVEGVYVAALTPRRQGTSSIDLASGLELIDFLCDQGVAGIALLGSTGEFPHFDVEERIRYAQLAGKRSRVPVLVNVSHSTLDGAAYMGHLAAESGAAGLLLMPPYVFRHSPEAVREFFIQFAAQMQKSIPLYLYNMPLVTTGIEIETAVELLGGGVYSGIKDSSGNWEYLQQLQALRNRTPFTLFAGTEALFIRARTAGASGVISGLSNCIPELIVALDKAIVAQAPDRIARLEALLVEFLGWYRAVPFPASIIAAAEARGIKTGPAACPLGPDSDQKMEAYLTWFREWLPSMQKECAS